MNRLHEEKEQVRKARDLLLSSLNRNRRHSELTDCFERELSAESTAPERDPLQGTLPDTPENESSAQGSASESEPRSPRTGRPPVNAPADATHDDVSTVPERGAHRPSCVSLEVSRFLEDHPGTLKIRKKIRARYVDPNDPDRGVVFVDRPKRELATDKMGPGLLGHIVVSRYIDHMSLSRQAEVFAWKGLDIPVSTLVDWIGQVALLLRPLYDALKQEVLEEHGYLQVNETTIQVRNRARKGKTLRGHMWTYLANESGLMVMEFSQARARGGPVTALEDYSGALQTDGFNGEELLTKNPSVEAYGCMAQARRSFAECRDTNPDEANHVLGQIKRLYLIERQLREQDADSETRRKMRQKEAQPILNELKSSLQANAGISNSRWRRAVRYSLGRWDKLTRYVNNGQIEIDANRVESGLRPLALGGRNNIIAGSHKSAQQSVIFYSLLGSCKLHDIDPQEWLIDVTIRIPPHPTSKVGELLPHRWQSAEQSEMWKAN